MSGILNKIKNHKKKVGVLFVLLAVFLYSIVIGQIYLIFAAFVVILGIVVNSLAVKKMRYSTAIFYAGSKVRNIDALIIGEPCDLGNVISKNASYVQITAPGRTLEASYEIMRHTFGILREDGGQAILIVKKESFKKGFSVFDIPYFQLSPVSVKRLGVENLQKKSKWPLLFSPINTCKLLFSIGNKRSVIEYTAPEEILEFCHERNINLKCMVVE